jgi:hypothetical protein
VLTQLGIPSNEQLFIAHILNASSPSKKVKLDAKVLF